MSRASTTPGRSRRPARPNRRRRLRPRPTSPPQHRPAPPRSTLDSSRPIRPTPRWPRCTHPDRTPNAVGPSSRSRCHQHTKAGSTRLGTRHRGGRRTISGYGEAEGAGVRGRRSGGAGRQAEGDRRDPSRRLRGATVGSGFDGESASRPSPSCSRSTTRDNHAGSSSGSTPRGRNSRCCRTPGIRSRHRVGAPTR